MKGLIVINERIARIVKEYNPFCWRWMFIDNKEIVNVFYHLEEEYEVFE